MTELEFVSDLQRLSVKEFIGLVARDSGEQRTNECRDAVSAAQIRHMAVLIQPEMAKGSIDLFGLGDRPHT